jgi:hypothetical protein
MLVKVGTPAIAKRIHRPTQHTWRWLQPAATSPRINVHRVHRKGGGAISHRIRPRQARLSWVCVEGVAPCTSPAPSPTSHLRAPDPALVSQLLAQGYSHRNHKMDITVINFSFKIFYTFSLNINFSLQILTLVVLYGTTVIGLGCPLNALL